MLRQATMRPLGPAMGTAAPTTPIANSESLVAYAQLFATGMCVAYALPKCRRSLAYHSETCVMR